MKKEKTTYRKPPGILAIVVIIVLINVFGTLFAAFSEALTDLTSSGREEYSNLEVQGVTSEALPEYGGRKSEEGYQVYRFDIILKNTGTKEEMCERTQVYLGSEEGYASEIYEDTDTMQTTEVKKEDTRCIPPGREGTVTLYGIVGEEVTEVKFTTYSTKSGDSEPVEYQYTLPEQGV